MTKQNNSVIIRPSKRTREKTKTKKSEIHSIHSIDAHERMKKKKGKGDSSGNINNHIHQYESDRNRISCKKDLIQITYDTP